MNKQANTYTLKGGTVYQFGNNAWRAWAVYYKPTGEVDADGKPVMRRASKSRVFNTPGKRAAKAEALAWVEQLNAEASRGPKAAETVGEYLAAYLDGREGRVERSTISHERTRARHIFDGLGAVKLAELTPDMVNTWMNDLNKTLSAQYVNDILALLKAAMKDAERNGAIDRDPVANVKRLKITHREPNALNAAERERLINDLFASEPLPNESEALTLGIKIALLTGMRRGEICALRWRNVDFGARVIHVRESIGLDGETPYIKEPKSGGSRRDIPMGDLLASELRARRAHMEAEALGAGVPFNDGLFVIGGVDGSFKNPKCLYRAWARRRKRLGLTGNQGEIPCLHDLRHTFATTAISEGVDVKSVSSLLGHADASMTLNIYASADADAKRRAMDRVNDAMFSPAPKADVLEFKRTGTED